MKPTAADPSIFISVNRTIIVASYVDDLIILSKSINQIQVLKAALSKTFEMKDLGEVRFLLGMNIRRNREQGVVTID